MYLIRFMYDATKNRIVWKKCTKYIPCAQIKYMKFDIFNILLLIKV